MRTPIASVFGALLLSVLAFPFFNASAETPPTEFPAEIQAIFQKDPATLTDQERALALPYLAPSVVSTPAAMPAGAAACFDYYRFGSVTIDLVSSLERTIPGVPMAFAGTIKNENPYPVVGGSVYVKIFKAGEGDFTRQNGYPVVDFFEAGKDISIAGQSEVPFEFQWKTPHSLADGEYEAAVFFVTGQRFNLLGLTFTDDVTGSKVPFRIASKQSDQVVFKKGTVTMNGNPYGFASFPPHFTADEPVYLKAELSNPGEKMKTVKVVWKLYDWDGLREDRLVDTITRPVKLDPRSTQAVEYVATQHTGAVSYVVGTVMDGDAASIIDPRFVRDGVEDVRLNFPSLLSFPIREDQENTLFSCVHSTNLPLVAGNALTMTLTDDETGDVMHTYTYTGDVTGTMMGVKDTFVPDNSSSRVTLTTTLSKNGETIDTVSQTYDCAALGLTDCPPAKVAYMSRWGQWWMYGVLAILPLIVLGGIWVLRCRRQNPKVSFPVDHIITPSE